MIDCTLNKGCVHRVRYYSHVTYRFVTRCGWLVPHGRGHESHHSLPVLQDYAVKHNLNLCIKCFGREVSLQVAIGRGLIKIDRHYLGPCYFPNLLPNLVVHDSLIYRRKESWKPNLPQFLETYAVCSTAREYMQQKEEESIQEVLEVLVTVTRAARHRAGLAAGATLALRRGKYRVEIQEV